MSYYWKSLHLIVFTILNIYYSSSLNSIDSMCFCRNKKCKCAIRACTDNWLYNILRYSEKYWYHEHLCVDLSRASCFACGAVFFSYHSNYRMRIIYYYYDYYLKNNMLYYEYRYIPSCIRNQNESKTMLRVSNCICFMVFMFSKTSINIPCFGYPVKVRIKQSFEVLVTDVS